jgi:hypothetical protein
LISPACLPTVQVKGVWTALSARRMFDGPKLSQDN